MIYPIEMNGRVRIDAISGNNVSLLCNKLIAMNLDSIKDIVINVMFKIVIIIKAFDITDLVLFPELISLLIANCILKLAKDNRREKVGIIIEYIDIPSKLIILVYTTFIIRPNILVKNPPIIRNIVDFKNIFFIVFLLYKFLFLLYNCSSKEYWWWLYGRSYV